MTAAAFEKPLAYYSAAAAADLSAKQYFACKLNSSGAVALCSVAGERVLGILYNEPASGRAAQVMTHGIARAEFGGTVAVGDSLMTDASGNLVEATGGAFAIGTAMQAAVDGDVKAFLIRPHVVSSFTWTYALDLATVADGDVITTVLPGFAGKLESFHFVVDVPVTTGSKASTLNLEIGTTNVTGGALALTSANCTPQGAEVDASAITAANEFTAAQTISVEAASTTTFIEGSGTLKIKGSHRLA